MTRDTSGPVAQDTSKSDDDVYAALWQAAPFPRLPADAPNELKKLTINIEDPRRVYAIHRASRRHNFQILVERYIIQLRYGCQASYCTTSTCFTCRKRLAGGAPVRRYNATSARTLAVYLASQDNPELGLCQHPSVNPPEPQTKNSSPLSKKPSKRDHGANRSSGAPKNASEVPRPKIKVEVSTEKLERKNSRKSHTRQDSDEKRPKDARERENELEDSSVARMLKEPSKKDHKSFVQNVFGTTAFKMLEWLSPRNFEILMKSESEELARRQLKASPIPTSGTDDDSKPTSAEASKAKKTDNEKKFVEEKSDEIKNNKQKANIKGDGTKPAEGQRASAENDDSKKGSELDTHGIHSPKTHDDFMGANTIPSATIESKLASNATTRNAASKGRRNSRAKVLDSKPAKDILNTPTSPRIQSYSPDLHTASREPKSSKPERKLSRHTSLASPGIDEELEVGTLERKMRPLSIRSSDNLRFDPSETKELSKPTPPRLEPEVAHENQDVIANESTRKANNTSTSTEVLLPQSLSRLSIEIIDLLCDILQEDLTSEKHSFVPAQIPNMSSTRKRAVSSYSGLSRSSRSQLPPAVSYRLKTQWSTFIEQSLFDVLSNPDALLRSFCDEEGLLFDTQTIWYLMLRMTRVAPSVVFHSLWVVAGNLFTPPNGLEHELSKTELKFRSNHSISNSDAAQIMTICLNALVAAAPHVTSASQLSNMSRTRSFGQLSMLGRDSTPISLCLQYEDAFTNELCLRLARRLFAAIPTRRRYTELVEINSDTTLSTEPDLLQSIFSSLKFLDLRPSVLDFTNTERDLHEKRLPTLILDWARTVMMQDWQGTAEVSRDGSFGGALAMIAAIYENRKSLLLGDIHFYSTYFNERLDSMEMPVEWLSFESNKRTVHLLDYPYLFNPSTLVTYFRSINFSRMSRSFEAARSMQAFAHYTAAEKQLMIDAQRRHKLYERLRTATSKFNVLHIRRDNVLVDAFNHIWRREERELMRPLKIRLGEESGEEGSDSGGVQQEFFRLAIAEALNPDYGTFTIDQRTKMTWFQPGSPEPLWKFELIGLIVSLAVYNGLTLPVTFPKALYRKLLDQDITELHHISDGWPDLANGLTTLLEWDEKEGSVEDIFCRTYEFSVEQFGQPISRTMNRETHWPQFSDSEKILNPTDAPLVTGENRSEYVTDYVHWLTDVSVRPQFAAFKRGFFTCINPRSITLFTPEILQSVVEGVQEIDIADLRRYTRYVGWDASHKTVKDFWSVVKKYDFEQKRKLLEFVTASDRVPVGGMRNLQFVVQRNGVGDGHLPTSYTCYGTLLLPEYSSKEVLREKVAMALENSKGFGFA